MNIIEGDSALPYDEVYTIGPPGIPNIPQAFFNEPEYPESGDDDTNINGEVVDPESGEVVKGCKHPIDYRQGTLLKQLTGYDACKLESIYWSDPVTD